MAVVFPYVVLDLFGTLAAAASPGTSLEEVPVQVEDGLRLLQLAGFRLVVVCNRPEHVAAAVIERQHAELLARFARQGIVLEGIRWCPHQLADGCVCHVPDPGLLFGLPLRRRASWVVGGHLHTQLAERIGCRAVLIGVPQESAGQYTVPNLQEAALVITSAPRLRSRQRKGKLLA